MKNIFLSKAVKSQIKWIFLIKKSNFSEVKRVVVTGLGAVTPLGNNLNTTWSNLIKGNTGIKYLNKTSYFEQLPKSHLFGAPVDKEYFKNNKKFRTLATDNLLTQITMSSFFESLEDSKLVDLFESGKFNPYRVGVVTGTSAPSLNCIVDNTIRAIENKSYNYLDRMGMPKLLTNLLNFNISKVYSFLGPTMALSLSCASGLNSIGEAMKMIKNNECDICVSGSVEASLGPYLIHSMNKLGTLYKDEQFDQIANSKDENLIQEHLNKAQKPFDKDRNGLILGEGCGILILEELNHAIARGAKIYCEIIGYSTNGDSYHLTKPKENGVGGFLAMLNCMKNANIGSSEIDLISCHATSTETGDISELNSIISIFGNNKLDSVEKINSFMDKTFNKGDKVELEKSLKELYDSKDYKQLEKLRIMASKTQLGHLLGAAGSVESIVGIKCMENNVVLDNFNTLNPIDDNINFWNSMNDKKYIDKKSNYLLKNSFAFGGVNSSIIYKKYIM